MGDAATGQVPATNGVVPPQEAPDQDAARYEALAKELGPPEIEPEVQPEPEAQPKSAPEPETKARPSYEELEGNYKNVRTALQQARDEAKASNEQLARFMRIVEDARGKREPEAKKDEPVKLPEVTEDPIGHFTGRIAQLEAQLAEANKGVQATTEEQRAYQQQQAMWQQVARSEQDIRDPKSASHKPDYDDACAHLEGQRIKQLNRMYPDESPYAANFAQQQGFRSVQDLKLAILNQDRQSVAIQALQMGMSPAVLYYELAQESGYQPKANGKAPADKAALQIAATKRGQKAAVSISGDNSGRKGSEDMSVTDLADLFIEDGEAADKIWDQMKRSGQLG